MNLYLVISQKASRGWYLNSTLGKKCIAVKKPTKKISEIIKKSPQLNLTLKIPDECVTVD